MKTQKIKQHAEEMVVRQGRDLEKENATANRRIRTALQTTLMILCLAWGIAPASAQNAVPPTARAAATSPAYAPRLKGSAKSKGAKPSQAQSPSQDRPASPQDPGVLYDNGPVNGNADAWTINFGYTVSDSFTLTNNSTVEGFQFFVWVFPGDVPATVDWSITSQPSGGTIYGSGTSNLTDTFLFTNNVGYNVDQETVAFVANVPLDAGTYYLNLTNTVVPSGDPVYWDENSGTGCGGDNGSGGGCPSTAYESAVGTIPSEAFQVTGTSNQFPSDAVLQFETQGDDGESMVTQPFTYNSVPCPVVEAIVDDFTIQEDGTASMAISGVVTDQASDLVDPNSGKQLQTLQVSLEETALGDPIQLTNTGTSESVWEPYKFQAPFFTRVSFTPDTLGALRVNLTTSENVAGCASTATFHVNIASQGQIEVTPQANTDPGTFFPTILRIYIPPDEQLQPPYPQILAFGQPWNIDQSPVIRIIGMPWMSNTSQWFSCPQPIQPAMGRR